MHVCVYSTAHRVRSADRVAQRTRVSPESGPRTLINCLEIAQRGRHHRGLCALIRGRGACTAHLGAPYVEPTDCVDPGRTQIASGIRKARKFFVFLRERRHELLDATFRIPWQNL